MARVVRRMRQSSALLLAVMLSASAHAQGTGTVRGAIYDSLSNKPLRGATVFISGSTKLGISNELGEFESGMVAKLLGTVPAAVFGGVMCLGTVFTVWFLSPRLRKLDLNELGANPA